MFSSFSLNRMFYFYLTLGKEKISIIFFPLLLYTLLMVQNIALTYAPKCKYIYIFIFSFHESQCLTLLPENETDQFWPRTSRHQQKRMQTSTRLCSWLAGKAKNSRGTEIITFRKHPVILYLLWIGIFVYQN